MTITELLSQIYNEADRKGIDLTKFGIHDDEDLIVKALTLLTNDLEDFFWDDDVDDEDNESEEWNDDITDEEFNKIVGIRA